MAPSASGGQPRGHLLPHRLRRGRLWSQLRGRPPGHTGHPLLDIGHKIDKAASVLSVPAERSNLQQKNYPLSLSQQEREAFNLVFQPLEQGWSQKQRIHARGHFSCQRKDRIQGGNLFHKTPLSPSCHKCDFCFILCSVIWLLCGACSELRRVYPSGACNCHSAWQVPEKAPPVSASLCVISTTLLYPHHDSIPLRSYCRSRSSYRGIKLVRRLL